MNVTYRFIEPLDVLFLRGNKLFGDPGSHGESLVPPWPSVAAGALRSLMLAVDGVDIAAFARGAHAHPTLGTPARPGSFALTGFDLARRDVNGGVETLHALPADLALTRDEDDKLVLNRLQPQSPAAGLASSAPLAQWPVLAQARRGKSIGSFWLRQAAWAAYLAGGVPVMGDLVSAAELWKLDARVGVGLDTARRRAEDGKLFTAQAVAFARNVGFLATIRGAEPPQGGMLRFGGDGRGAAMQAVEHAQPDPDWDALARARRLRIVLTTPGLFPQGWLLPGVDAEWRLKLDGIGGRLVCAAVPRAEVVSGWDLALKQPKPAERVAPIGSIYWIDDLGATPEQLRKLADRGLWAEAGHNAARQAEGFNRFALAPF